MNDLVDFEAFTTFTGMKLCGTKDSTGNMHGYVYTYRKKDNVLYSIMHYRHGKLDGAVWFYNPDTGLPIEIGYVDPIKGAVCIGSFDPYGSLETLRELIPDEDNVIDWVDHKEEDYDRVLKKYNIDINDDPRKDLKK